MEYCRADAQKFSSSSYRDEPSELEQLLTKPRQSREAIQDFIAKAKKLPTEPPKQDKK